MGNFMAHFHHSQIPPKEILPLNSLKKKLVFLYLKQLPVHETSSTYYTTFFVFRLHRKTSGSFRKKRPLPRCLQSSEPDKSQGNDPEGCPESTRWSRWRFGWGGGGCIVVPAYPTAVVGNGDCKVNLKQNALHSGLGFTVI